MMDVGPTPEFRQACREVLGGDDPATVINGLRSEKADLVRQRHAEILEESAVDRDVIDIKVTTIRPMPPRGGV